MEFIWDFWESQFPNLSQQYGDIVIVIFVILTIIAMLRLILMTPLYFLGSRKKI